MSERTQGIDRSGHTPIARRKIRARAQRAELQAACTGDDVAPCTLCMYNVEGQSTAGDQRRPLSPLPELTGQEGVAAGTFCVAATSLGSFRASTSARIEQGRAVAANDTLEHVHHLWRPPAPRLELLEGELAVRVGVEVLHTRSTGAHDERRDVRQHTSPGRGQTKP